MRRDYAIVVTVIDDEYGTSWEAYFPDVEGCVGGGDTPEEAVAEAYENLEFHLEGLEELGRNLPVPKFGKTDYSGKFVLRTSKYLHRRISEYAESEGISINSFINEAISYRMGKLDEDERIIEEIKKTLSSNKMYSEMAFEVKKEQKSQNINQLSFAC